MVERILLQIAFLYLDRVFVKGSVFSGVLSAYHCAAQHIKLLVSIAAEFRCVSVDSKPKRRRSASKISVI